MNIQRKITDIVIHCSDSPNGRHHTVADIDAWHRERGFIRPPHWRIAKKFNTSLTSVGYHFVIYIDGTIVTGRHPDEIGAHVAGHNTQSLGICLIGKDEFSEAQFAGLKSLCVEIIASVTTSPVIKGHCEYDTAIAQGKTCPNFSVKEWLRTL